MGLEMSSMVARVYAPVGYLWFCLEVFNGYVTFKSFCFQIVANQISVASEKMPSSRTFFKQIIFFAKEGRGKRSPWCCFSYKAREIHFFSIISFEATLLERRWGVSF